MTEGAFGGRPMARPQATGNAGMSKDTPSSLIERVARAMWERTHDGTWPREDDIETVELYREDARVAVAIVLAGRSWDLRAVLSDMVGCAALDQCSWRQDAPASDCKAFCSACGSGFDAAMVHMACRVVAAARAVRAEERERCAQIAERYWHVQASVDIADLIRGGSE